MSSSVALGAMDGDSSIPGGGPPKSSAGAPAPRPAPRPPRSPPARNTTPPTGFATTSVVYCLAPSLFVHSRVCSRPSMYTCLPLERYSPQFSAVFPHTTTRCHSVRSCFWPDLSVQASFVATVKFATACPLGVYRTSGSRPRLPIRMTLLTPAMLASLEIEAGTLTQGPDNERRLTAPGTGWRLGRTDRRGGLGVRRRRDEDRRTGTGGRGPLLRRCSRRGGGTRWYSGPGRPRGRRSGWGRCGR